MSRFETKSSSNKVFVKPEGYIDEKRNVFVVTNYQECIDSGVISYIELKTAEQKKQEHQSVIEMLKKYKPEMFGGTKSDLGMTIEGRQDVIEEQTYQLDNESPFN